MVGPMSATQTSTHCCGWALEIEARRQAPRVDPRLVIGIGFALFAASNFMNITMTNDYAADQLFWPNVVRDVGQALCFAPMSAVATAGIEAENAGSASALFNMMRNLGGTIGIAALQTLLTCASNITPTFSRSMSRCSSRRPVSGSISSRSIS